MREILFSDIQRQINEGLGKFEHALICSSGAMNLHIPAQTPIRPQVIFYDCQFLNGNSVDINVTTDDIEVSSISFINCTLETESLIAFKEIFAENVSFYSCRFLGSGYFRDCQIGKLVFEDCMFVDEFEIHSGSFKNIEFKHCHFKSGVIISGCPALAQINFRQCWSVRLDLSELDSSDLKVGLYNTMVLKFVNHEFDERSLVGNNSFVRDLHTDRLLEPLTAMK